jgi:hypothetical protein
MLRNLAERGFAPVSDEEDSVAELLARQNVGGLVRSHATVVGTPHDVLTAGGAKQGMVPSSNFIRHMIAEELYYKAKPDAAAAAEKTKTDAAAAAEKPWARARAIWAALWTR